VDKREPLTKKERRKRRRQLEQALRRKTQPATTASSAATPEEGATKKPDQRKRPEITAADIQGLKSQSPRHLSNVVTTRYDAHCDYRAEHYCTCPRFCGHPSAASSTRHLHLPHVQAGSIREVALTEQ